MKICKELIEKRKRIWESTDNIEEDKEYNRYICAIWNNDIPYKDKFVGKEITKEIEESPWLMIELFFRLTNKDFNQVPFFLNEVQQDFQEKLGELYKLQKNDEIESIKIKILKGRQQGFTTYITAFQECLMMTEKGFRGFTMAHDTDSTKSIFDDIAKGFYDNLIEELREEPKRSNAKELVIESVDSAWRVATAGSKGAGRGKKLRFLHKSERAFWENAEINDKAIGQALAKKSIEIEETTANGYGEYKDSWDSAVRGESVYIPIFYVWHKTSEYFKTFKGISYTKEEFKEAIEKEQRFKGVDSKFMSFLKTLLLETKLSLEQVHWYFSKRQELKNGVYQEYPCFPEQAFLHSGSPYFDVELLDIQIKELENKEFKSLHGGEIEVYKEPKKNGRYVMGSDVAEGLDDGDSSSFSIIDVDTMEEVVSAEYTQKPEVHARTLYEWSKKYNNCLIAVERNNHGHSTLNTLSNELNYKRNLYVERTVDKRNNKITDKLGWSTNAKSKYIMLDDLDNAHRNDNIKINSVRTLRQMREIQTEDGKVDTNGKDRVIATAIAYQMAKNNKPSKLAEYFKNRR